MKKQLKSVLGVTLLEVMLVLEVAAVMILMSVRYYQSATAFSQSNTAVQQIEAVVLRVQDVMSSNPSMWNVMTPAQLTSVTNTLNATLPLNYFVMPWGGSFSIAFGSGAVSLNLSTIPNAVCPLLMSRLLTDKHWSIAPSTPANFCNAVGPTNNAWFNYFISV